MKSCLLTLSLFMLLPGIGARSRDAFAQAEDARDVKARELFTVGKYQDAIDLYGKLYAETLHPTYLRNVGRCYQMMGSADQAISSFRDYLRRSKNLTPDARAEVDGFIHEMEALKQKQAASKQPEEKPVPSAAGVPPLAPALRAVPLDHPATTDALGLAATHPAQLEADKGKSNTKWWVWGGAGVLAVGATVAAILFLQGGGQGNRPTSDLGWHKGGG